MRLPWIAAGIAAVATVLCVVWAADRLAHPASSARAAVGGPFTLVDTQGHTVTDRDLQGKPSVIYFGFTYCPEICPTTLTAMTQWIKALGPDADKLNFAFVTIDPERDTPAQMKLYLSAFDPHIRGLTGTTAQVARIAKAYGVYYQKVPIVGGGYTMDHSTAVYLMDSRGRFDSVITYQEPSQQAVGQLRALAAR